MTWIPVSNVEWVCLRMVIMHLLSGDVAATHMPSVEFILSVVDKRFILEFIKVLDLLKSGFPETRPENWT